MGLHFDVIFVAMWEKQCSFSFWVSLFSNGGALLKFLFGVPGSIAHQLPFAALGQLILMDVAGGLGNGLLLVDITNSCEITLSTHAAILLWE